MCWATERQNGHISLDVRRGAFALFWSQLRTRDKNPVVGFVGTWVLLDGLSPVDWTILVCVPPAQIGGEIIGNLGLGYIRAIRHDHTASKVCERCVRVCPVSFYRGDLREEPSMGSL